jgi:dTDP-4-amino-4,6-dideoxygalactose transaminase
MEMEYVREAFETNWISPVGPNITAFEGELARYNGVGYCAALSSGTAAIHLALIILGVQRGDEVICSTFTFSGSCNPIIYQGATPVFVDSERETWNMDPYLLEVAIKDRIAKTGKRPKAIILVHLYGMPAKVNEILAITRNFEIPVIEDAAEAIGSKYHDKYLGGFGDLGVYSFNGNKIITTSGGGALVSDNETWIQKARFLATQAREHAPHYQHVEIGYNYRLSNVCAGIGRGQLQVLNDRVAQRRSNFEYYKETLKDTPGISLLDEPPRFFSNRWLTTILIDPIATGGVNREGIRIGLQDQNVETRPLWKPMHLQPVFKDAPTYASGVSEELFDKGLCLPSGSNLTKEELKFVVASLLSMMASPRARQA